MKINGLYSHAPSAYHHCANVCSKRNSNPYFQVIGCCVAASPEFSGDRAGCEFRAPPARRRAFPAKFPLRVRSYVSRSEEHTSELQSLMRNSYAVFCLKTKKNTKQTQT